MLSSIVSTVTQFPNSAMGTTVNDGAQTGSRGLQGGPEGPEGPETLLFPINANSGFYSGFWKSAKTAKTEST